MFNLKKSRSVFNRFKRSWSQNLSKGIPYFEQKNFQNVMKDFCSIVDRTAIRFWDPR